MDWSQCIGCWGVGIDDWPDSWGSFVLSCSGLIVRMILSRAKLSHQQCVPRVARLPLKTHVKQEDWLTSKCILRVCKHHTQQTTAAAAAVEEVATCYWLAWNRMVVTFTHLAIHTHKTHNQSIKFRFDEATGVCWWWWCWEELEQAPSHWRLSMSLAFLSVFLLYIFFFSLVCSFVVYSLCSIVLCRFKFAGARLQRQWIKTSVCTAHRGI